MAGGGGSGDGDFGFQIAPMVDVVFVLLLFFMACAGTNQVEGLLKIALPSQGDSHPG
jgi:biopolymer transport protein ExbD